MPSMRPFVRLLSPVLALLALGAPAHAAPIALEFSGTIGSSAIPGIAPGETYTFSLGYDDATPDMDADPNVGVYAWLSASVVFSGGVSDSFLFGNIRSEDALPDVWSVSGVGGATIDTLIVQLHDDSGAIHADDGLILPVLANYPDVRLLDVFDSVPNQAIGDVSSVLVVPEPSSLLLATLGLTGLAVLGRRRSA